jgi:thiol-disulfide isomerase/thioredoxin
MRAFLILCAFLAVAACQKKQQPAANQNAPAAEVGPHKGVDRSHKGQPALNATFNDFEGHETSLKSFHGKPVLMNLWATWCIPCRTELPTLDKLAAAQRTDGKLSVIAVSQDSAPDASVKAVLAELKIKDLGAYHDPHSNLSGALGPDTVLPTSILYDAGGHEVWRYVGELDWTGPEAARLLAEAKPGGKG